MREEGAAVRLAVAAPAPASPPPRRIMLFRAVAFFALWLVLMQSFKAADLLIGLGASMAATWVSLRLLPPASGGIRFTGLLLQVPHLLWESVRAGVDVAARALAPSPRLNPGFVSCPLSFPPGMARNTFAAITGLLPGSVACGEVNGVLAYHCLDIDAPVLEQLLEEERRLLSVLLAGQGHD